MKLLLTCISVLMTISSPAQQKGTIVIQDTINLRGYVYNYNGDPLAGVTVKSAQKSPNWYYLYTTTDINGYFKLNGAMFNDTLSIGLINNCTIYNRGSRYMVAYMPPPKKLTIEVKVKGTRIHDKPPVNITIKQFETNFFNSNHIMEKAPEYPGGLLRYRDEILKQLIYPENAIENNVEGVVEIAFTVLKDGSVSNYKVLKGIGYGCDEEVIRIMKTLKKWKPGLSGNNVFDTNFTIDIEFKLTDN